MKFSGKAFRMFGILFIISVLVLAQSCWLWPTQTPPPDDLTPDLPFYPIMRLDETGDVGSQTSISVSGNNVSISYIDATNLAVKAARSADGGYTWTTAVAASTTPYSIMDTSVSVTGSTTNVGYGIYTGTASYTSEQWLAKAAGSAAFSSGGVDGPWAGLYSSITASGNTVFMAYYDDSNWALRFSKSIDGGTTWGTQMTIEAGGFGTFPDIAVSGSNVFISYFDGANGNLKVAKSVDGGLNWGATTADTSINVGKHSSICFSGSNVYVSYFDEAGSILKLAKSTNGGTVWTCSTIDNAGSVGQYSSIALSNGALCVSYYDITNGDLKFARSADSGTSWTLTAVESLNQVGEFGCIAANGDNIYISYYDRTNNDLKLARSRDGGVTW